MRTSSTPAAPVTSARFPGKAAVLAAAVLAGVGLSGPAVAQDAALTLELNTIEPIAPAGCRMTFVLTNETATDLSEMAYEVGIFDQAGLVSGGLLIMPFGAIEAGRMRIVLFDLDDRDCSDISLVLLNGVETCTDGTGGAVDICADALETRSLREGVSLRH